MKRKELKLILQDYYSIPMSDMILRGIRKPNYENMLALEKEHNIPFTAWKDIKSFISTENSTTTDNETSNIKITKKVS